MLTGVDVLLAKVLEELTASLVARRLTFSVKLPILAVLSGVIAAIVPAAVDVEDCACAIFWAKISVPPEVTVGLRKLSALELSVVVSVCNCCKAVTFAVFLVI